MLFSRASLSDVLDRVVRNVVQVLIPVLAIAAGSGSLEGLDYLGLADLAGTAALVTVLLAAANLVVEPSASLAVQAVERALKAFAGSLVATVGAVQFSLFDASWQTLGVAAASSAVLAVLQAYLSVPAAVAAHRGISPVGRR